MIVCANHSSDSMVSAPLDFISETYRYVAHVETVVNVYSVLVEW